MAVEAEKAGRSKKMNGKPPKLHFRVTVETEDLTGDVLSVYFQIRKGRHDHAKEFADGAAIADYDKHGYLLGVELLAPCKTTIADEVAKNEPIAMRTGLKRFMKRSGPRELVTA
ncbi:MAG: hypothetical protein HY000_20695 [Planctomycetes bacterium]|nr:hypothetical protein [Planctomycetota bacterium]